MTSNYAVIVSNLLVFRVVLTESNLTCQDPCFSMCSSGFYIFNFLCFKNSLIVFHSYVPKVSHSLAVLKDYFYLLRGVTLLNTCTHKSLLVYYVGVFSACKILVD